ncbi:protein DETOXIFICATION 35 [Sesamum angolense]|uniref:Protein DETOXIFICATION n=1 Tax=Sesamum angolense TaxID=2727404 RepID=A0AAE1TA69_9LAMI|nr:protein DETOXIFICATION 35 [Sesamum angolense]
MKKKRGRPKKLRRKGPDELQSTSTRKGLTHTCSKCLKTGHNKESCKNPIHPKSKFFKESIPKKMSQGSQAPPMSQEPAGKDELQLILKLSIENKRLRTSPSNGGAAAGAEPPPRDPADRRRRRLSSGWRAESLVGVFCIESGKLWRIGGPIVIQILCQYGGTSVATIFVGHLGDVDLSAFTIASTVIGTFAFGFMVVLLLYFCLIGEFAWYGSALETLCGQAFGAGQVHMLGVYMQRSMIILLATCILLLPIYVFATPILKLLGQQDEIAHLAGYYTRFLIPQLFSLAIIFPTQKFLQAQSKVFVLAWVAVLVLVSQIFWCWLFIDVFGWGTIGAAVAYDLTSWGTGVVQFVYVVGWCRDGWKGFSSSMFRDIWAFVKLSLASAVMLCLELWYMTSLVAITGNLDNAVIAVGSLSICMNIDGLEAMVFLGINAAVSLCNVVPIPTDRDCMHDYGPRNEESIGYVFTNSKEMQKAVAQLSGFLGVTMLLNSVQPVISGVAVGGGWQALVAYINLACYYIFGLPLGYLLGYVAKLGVVGIWGGMIAGVALQTLLLLLVVYRINWSKEQLIFLFLLTKTLNPKTRHSSPHCPLSNLNKTSMSLFPRLMLPPHPRPRRMNPDSSSVSSSALSSAGFEEDGAIKKLNSTEKGEKFERHCPEEGKGLNCLVPAPKGYRTPIPWPRSRDEIQFALERVYLQWWRPLQHGVYFIRVRDLIWYIVQGVESTGLVMMGFCYLRSTGCSGQEDILLGQPSLFINMKQPSKNNGKVNCSEIEPNQNSAFKYMLLVLYRIPGFLVHHLLKEVYVVDFVGHLSRRRGTLAIRPFNNSCYLHREEGTDHHLCEPNDDPDNVWYVDLKACITRLPEEGYGSNVTAWPERLQNPPDRLQSIQIDAYISRKELFRAESIYWKEIIEGYIRGLHWGNKLRNVLDMRAGFGGFAAALIENKLNCWVLNVVPVSGPNTLPVIYDRGLIGVMHDWCEPFDTYPRTYDLLHAAGLFSVERKRCNISTIMLEMDRILRPGGRVYIRDSVAVMDELQEIGTALGWHVTLRDTSEGPHASYRILTGDKRLLRA